MERFWCAFLHCPEFCPGGDYWRVYVSLRPVHLCSAPRRTRQDNACSGSLPSKGGRQAIMAIFMKTVIVATHGCRLRRIRSLRTWRMTWMRVRRGLISDQQGPLSLRHHLSEIRLLRLKMDRTGDHCLGEPSPWGMVRYGFIRTIWRVRCMCIPSIGIMIPTMGISFQPIRLSFSFYRGLLVRNSHI